MTTVGVIPRAVQAGIVKGIVVDARGTPLGGAFVSLLDSEKRAFTNQFGRFQIRDVPPDSVAVRISLIGYLHLTQTVFSGNTDTLEHRFVLMETTYPLQSVEVVAHRANTQHGSLNGVTSLQPREVKYKAGGAEDVLRSLQSAPGVTAPNDFSSQLVIRGSTPDQNLIILDGIEVFNPYRLYGVVSMFNPETVNDITLLTGGFPVQYSDRLSAVVDVTNREGPLNRAGFNAKLGMSVTNLNLVGEGAFTLSTTEEDSQAPGVYYDENDPPWKGSWLVSTRRTFYDLIAGPIARSSGAAKGNTVFPSFQDFQFKLTLQPHYQHKFVFTGLTNRDHADLGEFKGAGSIERISIDDVTFNDVAGVTWIWAHSPSVVGQYQLSFYQNGGSNNFGSTSSAWLSFGRRLSSEEYEHLRDSLNSLGLSIPKLLEALGNYRFLFRQFTAKGSIAWSVNERHTVSAGAGISACLTELNVGTKFDQGILAIRSSNFRYPALPESFESNMRETRRHIFLQDVYRPAGDAAFQAGLRLDNFGGINRTYLAPRITGSWEISPLMTVKAGWGMYYQSPGQEKSFLPGHEVYLRNTIYDYSNIRSLKAEQSSNFSLSWEYMLTPEWQLRIEGYDKRLRNLVVPKIARGASYEVSRIEGFDIRKPEGWSIPFIVTKDSLSTVPENGGSGVSRGIEMTLQKIQSERTNSLYGWISYAYAKSTRTQNGVTYPFDYDRRHTANLVLGWQPWDDLDISLTFTYGSGFPNTTPVGFKPNIVMEHDPVSGTQTPKIDTDAFGVMFFPDRGGLGNMNRARYPDYHRLDFRATTYTEWFGLNWSVYLDIINLYNRKNVILAEYFVDRETLQIQAVETTMFPFLPTIGFTITF
ncbi:MAG: carboxypeptidase-like regulatory domain-containing protein [Bacteroidetes bacterium]|nr:carboxypeptidase-like regulatory domain-containing protein [Bacteroidota bacterium]MCW5897544.1 carboxypeptidase-like regulatory domain-containing protein [Bacteroidota bacterium]